MGERDERGCICWLGMYKRFVPVLVLRSSSSRRSTLWNLPGWGFSVGEAGGEYRMPVRRSAFEFSGERVTHPTLHGVVQDFERFLDLVKELE